MITEILTLFSAEFGYYARTLDELNLCKSLVKKKFISRKKGTKQTFILSDFGMGILKRELSNIPIIDTSDNYNSFLKVIKKEYNILRTSYQPIVKIPELRNSLIHQQIIPKNSETFTKALLWLHEQGKITLEVGLTENEVNGGIRAKNGKNYFYLFI